MNDVALQDAPGLCDPQRMERLELVSYNSNRQALYRFKEQGC